MKNVIKCDSVTVQVKDKFKSELIDVQAHEHRIKSHHRKLHVKPFSHRNSVFSRPKFSNVSYGRISCRWCKL